MHDDPMYLSTSLLCMLQRGQRKAPGNKLSCSKTPKTQQVEGFPHLKKQVIFSGHCPRCCVCPHNNLACLGSFAKVSVSVQSIIPCLVQGIKDIQERELDKFFLVCWPPQRFFKSCLPCFKWDGCQSLVCVFYHDCSTCWVERSVATHEIEWGDNKRLTPKPGTPFLKWNINMKIQSQVLTCTS